MNNEHQKQCHRCNKALSDEERNLAFGSHCESCRNSIDIELEQNAAQSKQQRLEDEFARICPPLYQETDVERLPKRYADAVEAWMYGSRGLGIVGEVGNGKTRACYLLLKKQHAEGRSVAAMTGVDLSKSIAAQFSDDYRVREKAQQQIKELYRAEITLIDDLGKQKFTDAAEVELFNLLEYRTSNKKPTIWTANSSAIELLSRLSADRGEAIIRRLVEFSEVIKD